MSFIYVATNLDNGKRFVGCSVTPIKNRWKALLVTGHKRPISVAIKEFGIDKFSFKVVEECEDSERFDRVSYWINKLDCLYPKGYNKKLVDKANEAKENKKK